MLAKLQAGGTGWDVFVPTNYTITTYQDLDLIQPLDLARLPNYSPQHYVTRFTEPGIVGGSVYAVPKNWGTTGFVVNRDKVAGNPASWKAFWELAKGEASGRVIVHDYQLTTIGNALVALGYSFNSVDADELGSATASSCTATCRTSTTCWGTTAASCGATSTPFPGAPRTWTPPTP